MNFNAPPPGRPMTFAEWSTAIVRGVRARIPDVAATRRGRDVILRHDGRTARLVDDGATFWIKFGEESDTHVPMAALYDAERKDGFTTANFGRSIAGYFDAAHTRP